MRAPHSAPARSGSGRELSEAREHEFDRVRGCCREVVRRGDDRSQRGSRNRGEVCIRAGRGQRESVPERVREPRRHQMTRQPDVLEAGGQRLHVRQRLVDVEDENGWLHHAVAERLATVQAGGPTATISVRTLTVARADRHARRYRCARADDERYRAISEPPGAETGLPCGMDAACCVHCRGGVVAARRHAHRRGAAVRRPFARRQLCGELDHAERVFRVICTDAPARREPRRAVRSAFGGALWTCRVRARRGRRSAVVKRGRARLDPSAAGDRCRARQPRSAGRRR